MVSTEAAPDRGDLVWLSFDPQKGHEQRGRRPAVVLSPHEYNAKVRLALMCPITKREKGYPFEVKLPFKGQIQGVILADQVKSLDWRAREAEIVDRAGQGVVAEVITKLGTLLETE
ncbi:endoribonuclease MazF [Candidatus Fermentibacteria bacterium]|nr:endoribonuclease MazF [Candidatus Fermentibacteria bacterium]